MLVSVHSFSVVAPSCLYGRSLCLATGLYLTAALLKVFEQSLLKLPGPRIRQWFEEVGMNKPEWYRNLSVSVPEGVGNGVKVGDVKFLPDDWAAFTKGWIHCATGESNCL